MNFYILGKCVYYIFILASIIFPLQAFYKYFPRKGTSQRTCVLLMDVMPSFFLQCFLSQIML